MPSGAVILDSFEQRADSKCCVDFGKQPSFLLGIPQANNRRWPICDWTSFRRDANNRCIGASLIVAANGRIK